METNIIESRPMLLPEDLTTKDMWKEFHSHKTDKYKFKVEIQNHPIGNNERISCIGITIGISDCNFINKVSIQNDPTGKLPVNYRMDNKSLSIYYDKAELSNIINFLVNRKPIRITYGVFLPDYYNGNNYAAIEVDDNVQ